MRSLTAAQHTRLVLYMVSKNRKYFTTFLIVNFLSVEQLGYKKHGKKDNTC